VATAAPDMAFYTMDAAFAVAHDTYDMVVNLERNNRLLLWKLAPAIKHTLDATKDNAWIASVTYTTARAAYLANPTPAGLTTLQTALSQLQAYATAAQAATAQVSSMTSTNK
jgi:hypothetical protein